MTKYEKRLTKEIEERYNGLSSKILDKLIQYYLDNYGGEDGCEECYETHSLCEDCEQALHNKAYELTHSF